MEKQNGSQKESEEKKKIAKDVSEAINTMPPLSLARLQGFIQGMQTAEVKKAG